MKDSFSHNGKHAFKNNKLVRLAKYVTAVSLFSCCKTGLAEIVRHAFVSEALWQGRPLFGELPSWRLHLTTSSRDLQEKDGSRKSNNQSNQGQNHKEDESGVVQRLGRAIAQARANKASALTTSSTSSKPNNRSGDSRQRQRNPPIASSVKQSHLGSLRQLTKEIDHQLSAVKGPRRDQLIAGMAGGQVVLQPRDSMSALLEHNDKVNARSTVSGPTLSATVAGTLWPTRHVAVVFSKPLVDNQVTLEYASRLRAVAKAIQQEQFRPSLLCFSGGIAAPNVIADADAGLLFFRHLCAAQQISLNDIEFALDRTSSLSGAAGVSDYQSKDEGKALTHIIQQIQQNWLSRWLDEEFTLTENEYSTEIQIPSSDSDAGPLTAKRPVTARPKKLVIHFTLISTEYHLCNLNDIHHRSPRQSLLRPLAMALSGEHYHQGSGNNVQVEIIWSYQYSTYPSIYFSQDEAMAFMGKCYRLGEELVPLLVNMKGVVDSLEFFQRDNYLVLVSVRRALVKDLEALYGAAATTATSSLKNSLKQVIPPHSSVFGSATAAPLEVVLESAVLSLGRCLDLVRPAGQLKGAVSKQDWIKAVKALEQAMKQIRQACDPDCPLHPSEWGRFSDEPENLQHNHITLSNDGNHQDVLFEKGFEYDNSKISLAEDEWLETETDEK